jgi:ATP/maltotriose-dependent transcriptional regulator MalT/DNA-binding SARP family transcriptional activator
MAHSTSQLAKLTRPRLHAPIARERLFRLIDSLRSRPVIWIEGPPGAGKTTLTATYLDEAGLPGIWYQLDSGDSDPATFFYYLRKAALPFSRKRKPLPLLTPEYLEDLPGFGRRFFRDLLARMPPGAVLVLDNYHEVAVSSRLHEVFAVVVDEVPRQANLVVISRVSPPSAFARANVSDKIGRVAWDELRFTQEETRLIANSRAEVDGETVHYLFEQSRGWAAGVMLLLERMQQGAVHGKDFADTPEATFEYFASQIFDPEPQETRGLLMAVSFFPRVTVTLAEAISGNTAAGPILERLFRRRLFVDRRTGDPPAYQLHSLFRMFLQNRAVADLGSDRIRAFKLEAAKLLRENGLEEDALALYVQAGEWGAVMDLVARAAPRLIAHGRWQTLAEWIAYLPPEIGHANPWIRYWLGRSKILVDQRAAREVLEDALSNFEAGGDEVGQLLCAVAILEALYFQFDDFRAMEPWVARVARLIEKGVRLPHPEDELRASAAVLMAATYRAPRHAMLGHCVQRVHALPSEPYDVNLRVWIAAWLHGYANISMDEEAERVASRVGRALLDSQHVTPRIAFSYLASEAYTHYMHGRYESAFALLRQAEAIAQEEGLDELMRSVYMHQGLCERRTGRLDAAEATIDRLEHLGRPMSGYQNALLTFLKGVVALDRGRKDEGLRDILDAFHGFDASGHFNATVLTGLIGANAAIACSQYDTAERLLDHVDASVTGSVADNFSGVLDLSRAWLAHRRRDRLAADRLLGQALRQSRDGRARPRYRWYPSALAEMLPVALERGIEAQTARNLAQELGVAPTSALSVEDWPWPIKIYTLGRFELLIDGAPTVFERKAPKKALALLQAIIAFGSRDVSEDRLIDALWPDEEGDAAHRVFNTTLYRLRKLMRDNAAIVQTAGRLTLDPRRCWVDAYGFERALEGAGNAMQGHIPLRPGLDLYRGAFLAHEDRAPWIAPARERLRGKFVQAVRLAASAFEDRGHYDGAIGWYLRGLEADNLVEFFYQGLMRCYARLERSAEVADVYRRMQQALSISLGAHPSLASEKLYRQSLTAASRIPSNP